MKRRPAVEQEELVLSATLHAINAPSDHAAPGAQPDGPLQGRMERLQPGDRLPEYIPREAANRVLDLGKLRHSIRVTLSTTSYPRRRDLHT
ncbi:MAG: hypothetical protein NVS1B4_14560 [Gemmatimonadaceae bacterium]